jgi:hypothetical protein
MKLTFLPAVGEPLAELTMAGNFVAPSNGAPAEA